jgi:hypothetical protein
MTATPTASTTPDSAAVRALRHKLQAISTLPR